MFYSITRQLQLLAVCAAIIALALALGPAARAQSSQRCFPQTGFCISGSIRAYWERNGGLPVFGYPIATQRNETIEGSWTVPTQWFERDRLEDHANERKGVLAGRLGARYLEQLGQPWQRGQGANLYPYNPDCRTFFDRTGYQVCGSFRIYWEQNGGLERFGYPITEAREEQIEGRTYTVQYFERRRIEEHPEIAGATNQVLLGLLGRAVFGPGEAMHPPAAADVPGATQQAILSAAYASMRSRYPNSRIAVGVVDATDYKATVLARSSTGDLLTIDLSRRGGAWQVVPASETPGGSAAAIIGLALAQLQDPRGAGMNAYVTRPWIAGDWARVWFVPGTAEGVDSVSAIFRRESGTWRFVTAGGAFTEDDLRGLGVPQQLWPYGESVSGPSA